MITLLVITANSGSLLSLIVGFLILLVVLAIVAGLIWAIENWFSPIPPPVKLVIALILVLLVIIWAIKMIGAT